MGVGVDIEHHLAINQQLKQGPVDLLFIGDSIVQNWKFPEDGKPVWDQYYGRRRTANLGISGDRTEQVLWRLTHGNTEGITPKLAIIMIGQNNGPFNTAEEIAEGVTAIVKTVRERFRTRRYCCWRFFIVVKSPMRSNGNWLRPIRSSPSWRTNKTISFLNVNQIFLRPDGTISAELMPDFEHPSPKGFCVWAEAIEPKVAEMFGDTAVTKPAVCSPRINCFFRSDPIARRTLQI